MKTNGTNSTTANLNRREFLQASAAVAGAIGCPRLIDAQSANTWDQGQLAHLIPAANHERFLIKTSFKAALKGTPRLMVDGKPVAGEKTDPLGRFWRFDAASLTPATQYEMRLVDAGGTALCDAWPLKTFPAPDAAPEHVRILAYTCAGGYDGPRLQGKTSFLDMVARRRLLVRGMSYQPDAVIANGDHIYWDMETSLNKPFANYIKEQVWTKFGGKLDLSVPMLHSKNLSIFTNLCDYQIVGLYGTTLRSTPAFFLTDDHDNFENDEFDSGVATMPPDTYGTLGAEQTQRLYYPEFLPDRNQPAWLPGEIRLARRRARILLTAPCGTAVCWKPCSTTAGVMWTTKATTPRSFPNGSRTGSSRAPARKTRRISSTRRRCRSGIPLANSAIGIQIFSIERQGAS
jgi:hypothetical protein